MKVLHIITFLLLAIGGLNWGLIGIFDFNLVTFILGEATLGTDIVYTLVGLSALFELVTHPTHCSICQK